MKTEINATANFAYSFVIDGVQITLLDINGTIVDPIETNGEIFVDKTLPFFIEVRADLNSPIGSATFQLKDLDKNKDVFQNPLDLTFDATSKGGLFLKNVKLP
jgi:hypothetical protein